MIQEIYEYDENKSYMINYWHPEIFQMETILNELLNVMRHKLYKSKKMNNVVNGKVHTIEIVLCITANFDFITPFLAEWTVHRDQILASINYLVVPWRYRPDTILYWKFENKCAKQYIVKYAPKCKI